MSGIFRKAALDRLSSPEQLDKQIKITSPMLWLAAGGVMLALAAVVIWGCFGSLPEKVDINGILMQDGYYQGIYAETSGAVEMYVKNGDSVHKGDVVAQIKAEDVEKKVKDMENVILGIESITLTSTSDTALSEASPLLEIKQGYKNTTAKDQYKLQLKSMEVQYEAKKSEVENLKKQYKAAEAAYLNYMGNDAYNKVYFDYQEAVAKTDTATNAYASTMTTVNEAAANYSKAMQAYGESNSVTIAAKESYDQAVKASEEAKKTYEKEKKNLSARKKAYEKAYKSQNADSADKQALYNTFNEKSTLYNAGRNELLSIQSSINNLKMQIDSQQVADDYQTATAEENFQATKDALLRQYKGELENLKASQNNLQVLATVDGTISSVAVDGNQPISAGTCVARINVTNSETKHIVCFVPLSEVKKMKVGMEVTMTPSGVSEQEYGHLVGTVEDIAENNASVYEMTKALGDDLLVNQYQQQGASVRVILSITPDEKATNGFKWSNSKGSDLEITDNTVVIGKVITDRYAPITKLLPWLKEMMSSTGKEEE